MPSISISNSNVLPENLWISAEFLLFSTGPTLDGTNCCPGRKELHYYSLGIAIQHETKNTSRPGPVKTTGFGREAFLITDSADQRHQQRRRLPREF